MYTVEIKHYKSLHAIKTLQKMDNKTDLRTFSAISVNHPLYETL